MENRIKSLERKSKVQTVIILALAFALIWLYIKPVNKTNDDILQTKGIIIQDDIGNPRIAMGFPIDNQYRKRKDTLNGLVFMDENGMDRIHLGQHGKLFLGGKYQERLNDGWSLFFNDSKGEERSGYGFSDDDNSIGLGMDYGGEFGGEAIYLYAAPNISFMTINADLQKNKGTRDRIVFWHETDKDLSISKISDSKKDGRIILKAEKGRNPKIELIDSLNNKKTIPKNGYN
ncbi:hypothetical protein [Portibacter marinus]|uniref:hypothetical protein n=1 Tax=Portibacter marinus TaxID=2898660 RepID=UPI001F23E6CF|nr:hypothetical protein [Portibacter marinus]